MSLGSLVATIGETNRTANGAHIERQCKAKAKRRAAWRARSTRSGATHGAVTCAGDFSSAAATAPRRGKQRARCR